MKAKIKDTNEIINVKFTVYPNSAIDETYWWCQDKKESYHTWELDFLEVSTPDKLIDWEQRRYEIAKEVAAAYSIVATFVLTRTNTELARLSVSLADVLIKELNTYSNK